MGSTFYSVTVHVIFACKDRRPLITPDIAERLFPYIGGILRNRDCVLLEGGGVADHIHLLVGIVPRYALSDILRDVKANTSKWIHETWPGQEFAWQEGYGVFSVSISHIERTRVYIRSQEEHHKKHTLKEELDRFKQMHGLQTEDDPCPNDAEGTQQPDTTPRNNSAPADEN
jgi:putative transposase